MGRRIANANAPSIGLPEFNESVTTAFQSKPRTSDATNTTHTAVAEQLDIAMQPHDLIPAQSLNRQPFQQRRRDACARARGARREPPRSRARSCLEPAGVFVTT
jgi:hypothetical protein